MKAGLKSVSHSVRSSILHARSKEEAMTFSIRTAALAIAVAAGLGACDGGTDPQPGVPARVEVVDGSGQQGTVGQVLAQPVRVRVVDERGRPVPGQAVNFVVTAGNGTVSVAAVTSDREGIAAVQWTLGTSLATVQTLEARVAGPNGQAIVSDPITVGARADLPTRIISLVYAQGGAVGGPTRDSLAVRVLDRYNNPVSGVDVQWTAMEGSGSVSPARGTTSADGIARAQWTLGPRTDGVQGATASIPGMTPVGFDARAASQMTILEGNEQALTAGSEIPVGVGLGSPAGPVEGVRVHWTVLSGGGSVTPASSPTGNTSEGRASAVWTLGSSGGTQTLQATAGPLQQTFTAMAIAQGTRTLVAQVPGYILDADRSRILWVDFADPGGGLKLRTGGSDVRLAAQGITPSFLFPGGVLFTRSGRSDVPAMLVEYRDGALRELGTVAGSATVEGSWAAWAASSSGPVMRRNLALRQTDTVAGRHDQARYTRVDVGPDGDVVWNYHLGFGSAGSLLYSDRDGATSLLLNTSNQDTIPVLTDGVNIVYRTYGISTGSVAWWRVRDGDDELLAQASNPEQARDLAPMLNAGWLAWIERGPAAETFTGRLRSPDGTEYVIAPGLKVLRLEALSPDGKVVFIRGSPNGSRSGGMNRSITTPGGPVYDVGMYTAQGVVWAGDRFLLLASDVLYELGP
jgi:hypothetical protein